jgi:phosphonate transport system substrate-binding protein
LLAIAWPPPLRAAGAVVREETNLVLRLGFSSSVVANVNENDAKAALKIWTQAIAKERGAYIPTDAQVLNGAEAINRAVQGKLIDALTMTTEEYWMLGGERMSTNVILGINGGVATEEYLLLVRTDRGFARLDDLKGHSLAFSQKSRDSLAPVWFETLLLKSGLGQTIQFCGRIVQGAKVSQAVLPVFFRQTDACVVSRRAFETMTELNPQVGQQLRILASSPPVVPVVFLFRADYADPARDEIITEIEHVHSTVADQQVLTLFQCDRVEVCPVSALEGTLELLATHARLSKMPNQAEPARAGLPLTDAKTDGP